MAAFFIILNSLFCFLSPSPASAAQWADSTWAGVTRYIAVHPGTTEPVWENASRSLVTNGLQLMQPVGDGTYRSVIPLAPGATYNFMFFAKTGSVAPTGLQANNTYFDCVSTGGDIQSGTAPLKVVVDTNTTAPVHYGGVGTNNDARRVITVPANLAEGDTFYVYANFADRPISLKNFDVQPVDTTSVRLTWEAPYGIWGQNGEAFKAADVIAGGSFQIYRNTSGSTTSYTLINTIPGNKTSYYDSGLTVNQTYYYVITSYDAYNGLTTDSPFLRGYSDTTGQDSATPKAPVRVRFKVHHLDWNYIQQHDYAVFLTPEIPGATEEDVWFARRIQGVIRRVDL